MLKQLRSTIFLLIGAFVLPTQQLVASDELTHSCKQGRKTDTWTVEAGTYGWRTPAGDGYTTFGQSCIDMTNRHFFRFGFVQPDWDEGWGWEDVCDARRPLSKTFRMLELHRLALVSSLDTDEEWAYFVFFTSNETYLNFLRVMQDSYNYLDTNIVQLKAQCMHNDGYDAYSAAKIVTLYHRFFRPGIRIGDRAGLLIHEATHSLKAHNGGNKCPAKSSCDTNWDYAGAITTEIFWDVSYAMVGANTTDFIRQSALDAAKSIADNFFVINPKIIFPEAVPELPKGW